MSAKLIEVIVVEAKRGNGTPSDPSRMVIEVWTKEGDLLAERDVWKERQEAEKSVSDGPMLAGLRAAQKMAERHAREEGNGGDGVMGGIKL